jgi:hypothetical protein
MPTASGLLDPEGTEQFRQLCTNCGVPDQGEAFRKPVLYDVPLDLVDKFAEQVKAIGLDFCWRNPAASQAIRTNACS